MGEGVETRGPLAADLPEFALDFVLGVGKNAVNCSLPGGSGWSGTGGPSAIVGERI